MAERGRVPAAEVLGVNYRTLALCCDSWEASWRMRRVAALEAENAGMRELVDSRRAGWRSWSGAWRSWKATNGSAAALDAGRHGAGDEHGDDQGQSRQGDWRPPRRRPGMPDADVVTLEEQADEGHAFGPAEPLVAEWRRLRTGGNQHASRVERAQARVRRWELETEMLRDFQLTLPPEMDPVDESRRKDHVRWRREAWRRPAAS